MSIDESIKPDFQKRGGLLVAIVQDYSTKEVLMQAYMNEEAYAATLDERRAVYWSTSRNELWRKGETSGDVQIVKEVYVDCDLDSILLKVEQKGKGACHTGEYSCFYRRVADYRTKYEKVKDGVRSALREIWDTINTPPPPGWFPAN